MENFENRKIDDMKKEVLYDAQTMSWCSMQPSRLYLIIFNRCFFF